MVWVWFFEPFLMKGLKKKHTLVLNKYSVHKIQESTEEIDEDYQNTAQGRYIFINIKIRHCAQCPWRRCPDHYRSVGFLEFPCMKKLELRESELTHEPSSGLLEGPRGSLAIPGPQGSLGDIYRHSSCLS